jgi:mRNA-degrading endonuclease RelE of RelBE toxin-antitoxin system
VRFVETRVFTDLVCAHLEDDAYRTLQITLLLRPLQGPVIPASGGLRKIRWGGVGQGKRGGFRIIYFWSERESTCFMLFLYKKNEQGDLTPAQTRILSRIAREEFS